MLMRTDPFRELDRITQQLFNDAWRSPVMPMDAWHEDGSLWVEFDLPGVDPDSVDLKVDQDTLTIQAARAPRPKEGAEVVLSERPAGEFTRQLFSARTWTPSTSRRPTTRVS